MQTRKLIRDQIKTQLATQYAGKIFTGRSFDARSNTEFVNVFLASGDIDGEGMATTEQSLCVIGIHKQLGTDDELDALGEQLEVGLAQDLSLNGLVSGLTYAGYAYGDGENGLSQLFLKFNLTY